MASDKLQPLVVVGPFKGYDSTSAEEFLAPGVASYGSLNCDTTTTPGALVPYKGRANVIAQFTSGNVGEVTFLTGFIPYRDRRALVAYITSVNEIGIYELGHTGINLLTAASTFSSSFQYGPKLYLNNGTQVINVSGSYQVYTWQQPPTSFVYNTDFNMTSVSGTGYTPPPDGLYYYALTRVYTYADGSSQETSPDTTSVDETNYGLAELDGSVVVVIIYPFNHLNTTTSQTCAKLQLLAGHTWSGTAADGSTYSTNIYRQSTAQPFWYLLQNVNNSTTGPGNSSTTWVDNGAHVPGGNTDQDIAGNVQLDLNRDPPPFYQGAFGPIFTFANRAWVFATVNDADTLNQPQIQLWYSDYGIPWSFNKVNSVFLIGDVGAVNPQLGSTLPEFPFGEYPVWGGSIGSVGVLLLSKSMWLIYGNDPTTFIPIKAFTVGCIAEQSVVSIQGTLYWLSDQGVYTFNGAAPQYISEPIRIYLSNIPIADQGNAVGWFSQNTYWLSFPATNTTIGFYLPTQSWQTPLSHGTTSVWASAADTSYNSTPASFNSVLAVRPGTQAIDTWFSVEGDLGGPVQCNWQTGVTDAGVPWSEKLYQWLYINAPVQAGMAYITLQILGIQPPGAQTFTWAFNMLSGPVQVIPIPQAYSRGFAAELNISISTQWQGMPAYVYEVGVMGQITERPFIRQT